VEDQWDQEFVDAEVPGFFEFKASGTGQFQFGYVSGEIDCQACTRDAKPTMEFTWDGSDEMDRAHGRGWAVLNGNEIEGMIAFHRGNGSARPG
jgi:hypothetical protein